MSDKKPETFKVMSATGNAVTSATYLTSFLLTHDGTNDPTFTIYDAQSADANYKYYSGTWKDDERPLGWMNCKIKFVNGIHIVISNIGSGWFTFGHVNY